MTQLVLLYGLSGSGKSTSARILEDVGFRVLRNLPPFLIRESCQDSLKRDATARIAIFPELNNGDDVSAAIAAVGALSNDTETLEVFLDTSDEILLNRYKESRRPHPTQGGIGLREAIRIERALLAALRTRAHHVIETDTLKPAQLGDALMKYLRVPFGRKINLSFLSFGFKHGVPPEVDLCFDVRFLPNPFFVDHLREMSGHDEPVANFVLGTPETQIFLDKFESLFEFLLPLYMKEGKTYLTVGIGCTGGRHRSVAITNELAKRCQKTDLPVSAVHRDVQKVLP